MLKAHKRRPGTRETLPLKVRLTNYHNPSSPIYYPVFPLIWNDDPLRAEAKRAGNNDYFVKAYHVLLTEYAVCQKGDNEPIIRDEHVGLWLKINLACDHNEAFTHIEWARQAGISHVTLLYRLDRLEDAGLLHRERCPAFRGRPIDLVPHTPATGEELRGGLRKKLLARVNNNYTRQRREQMGADWPGCTRDLKTMLSAIKGEGMYNDLKKILNIV